jgi:phenylacetate-CoA ligase
VQCEPVDPGVDPARLLADVERVLHDQLGIRVRVDVLESGAVPRSEGKAVRVVDRRG